MPLQFNCFLVCATVMLGSASTITAGHQQGRDSALQGTESALCGSFLLLAVPQVLQSDCCGDPGSEGKEESQGDDILEMLWTSMAVH